MSEKPAYIRTTISVPADLKARMDEVKESVNWSAHACRAFEAKLAELAARKANKVMIDVVERLRASMRKQNEQSFNEGYKLGQTWAKEIAEVQELQRLQFHKDTKAKSKGEWENWFSTQDQLWIEVVKIIEGDENFRAGGALAFWKPLVGETSTLLNDGDFLRGFAEGAIDLWVKVQEQL